MHDVLVGYMRNFATTISATVKRDLGIAASTMASFVRPERSSRDRVGGGREQHVLSMTDRRNTTEMHYMALEKGKCRLDVGNLHSIGLSGPPDRERSKSLKRRGSIVEKKQMLSTRETICWRKVRIGLLRRSVR
jgi:hypothetical protein